MCQENDRGGSVRQNLFFVLRGVYAFLVRIQFLLYNIILLKSMCVPSFLSAFSLGNRFCHDFPLGKRMFSGAIDFIGLVTFSGKKDHVAS